MLATAALLVAALVTVAGCAHKPKEAPERKTYSFWPSAPDEPHIQFLTTFNSTTDLAPKRSSFDEMVYGRESEDTAAINKPYGVRMWNGRIYVCDVRSRGITVLDLRKQQARLMGITGSDAIKKAVDLAISPDGIKYVVDQGQQAIVVFDADERFVSAFPLRDGSPVGAAVYGNLLYVTDFKNAQVKVLDRASGKVLRTIGERGGGDGQFIGPLGVAVDKAGNVYVSDTIRARVQKFSPDGTFLMGFGEPGDRPGNFIRPKQIAVGSDGHIHVVDAAFNNVQVFDPEGQVVGYYGAVGYFPGAMDLPAGLDINEADLDVFEKYLHPAFQAERIILVANQFGPQKVSVYAMGHLKQGKTVADIAPGRASVLSGLVAATQPASATQPVSAETANTDLGVPASTDGRTAGRP
jgi:hypothetical protein